MCVCVNEGIESRTLDALDIRKKSVYGQVHKEGRDGIPVPEAEEREKEGQ